MDAFIATLIAAVAVIFLPLAFLIWFMKKKHKD